MFINAIYRLVIFRPLDGFLRPFMVHDIQICGLVLVDFVVSRWRDGASSFVDICVAILKCASSSAIIACSGVRLRCSIGANLHVGCLHLSRLKCRTFQLFKFATLPALNTVTHYFISIIGVKEPTTSPSSETNCSAGRSRSTRNLAGRSLWSTAATCSCRSGSSGCSGASSELISTS
ncbi:hypothetical protein I7I50_07095 [Histoplasma capsulatum G186AR]|nr:hypothetical protein I7I50_07095 [Histoplasma capsulatum G186AR]